MDVPESIGLENIFKNFIGKGKKKKKIIFFYNLLYFLWEWYQTFLKYRENGSIWSFRFPLVGVIIERTENKREKMLFVVVWLRMERERERFWWDLWVFSPGL